MSSLFDQNIENKNHAPVRELVLKPRDGKPTATTGLVDPRLFKGTNTLRAIMDETGLWTCKYDHGIVPDPLKQKFTSVSKLVTFAKDYFDKRNIDLVEVRDDHSAAL